MIQHNKYQEDNQSNRTGQIIKAIIQENFPEIKKKDKTTYWKNTIAYLEKSSKDNKYQVKF